MPGRDKRVYLPDALGYAAQYIYEFDPGPPLKRVKLLPADITLSALKRRLLRRAFHDCDRIYLRSLDGGRDSKGVFCVDAWLRRSEVGPRPLPFFVKISTVGKIEQERQNYQRYAEFFIPFYLRPNITPERCVTIGKTAALVGNFVEDSQTLRSALRSNLGPGILFSLFESSLKGFRLQPRESHMVREGSLKDFIGGRTRASKVPKKIGARARKLDLKLRFSPVQLEKLLCTAIKDHKCTLWPHHGDLHSGNVMVRGKDAIVIDFSAVKDAPISADVAALEVSLAFGTDTFDQPKNFDIWKEVIDEIYERVLCRQMPLEKPPGPYSWFRRAIRELHYISLGCDCKEDERKAVLAAYMIRFARLPVEDFAYRKLKKMAFDRHAYALAVAARIIQSLKAST